MRKTCNYCGRELSDGLFFSERDICSKCRDYLEERDKEVFNKKIKREIGNIKEGVNLAKGIGNWVIKPLLFLIVSLYILGGILTKCSS